MTFSAWSGEIGINNQIEFDSGRTNVPLYAATATFHTTSNLPIHILKHDFLDKLMPIISNEITTIQSGAAFSNAITSLEWSKADLKNVAVKISQMGKSPLISVTVLSDEKGKALKYLRALTHAYIDLRTTEIVNLPNGFTISVRIFETPQELKIESSLDEIGNTCVN